MDPLQVVELSYIKDNNEIIKKSLVNFIKALNLIEDSLNKKIEVASESINHINNIYTDSLNSYYIISKNLLEN
jgi:hypothetical protein